MGERARAVTLDTVRRVFDRVDRPGTPLTASEVAEEVGCARRTAHSKLRELADAGDLRTKKVGARGRVWWRPPPADGDGVPPSGDDDRATTSADSDRAPGDGARATPDDPQFRSLVQAVEEYAIFRLDAEGCVETWNAGAERIKGYGREEILGEHVSTFYTAAAREAGVPERNLTAATENGTAQDEGWRVCADGTRFWATVTITALRDEDGELQGFAKVTRDMTDRRERERAVLAERNLFDRVLESSPVGIGVFGPDGGAQRVNRRFAELLGLPGDDAGTYELGDTPLFDADGDPIPFEERPSVRTLATGEFVSGERIRVDSDDGQSRWLSVDTAPVERETGTGVVVTMADVTRLERQARRLERQRDDLESELAEVFERVDDGFFGLDEAFRFTYVNGRAEDLLQTSEAELLGETVWEQFPAATETPAPEAFETAMETQEPTRFETYYEPLGLWVEAHVYPSESGLSVYFRDVAERKERERELEESKKRFQAVFEEAFDAMVIADDDGTCLDVNPACCELFERPREELVGDTFARFAAEGYDFEAEWRAFQASEETRGQFPIRLPDGETRIAEFGATPSFLPGRHLSILRDVTDRVEHEQELARQRERLAALDDLNGVVRDITEAVVEQSTRAEIEAAVCERLAASDSYLFAWIGEVDEQSQEVTVRTEAGVEGYLDDVTVSVDPADEYSRGPTGRAVLEREAVVTQDVATETSYEPWRDHVEAYGYRSSAAIPITHDGALYGVLNVYTERPRAFDEAEREVIDQLGEVVGHAIAAIDRKRALMSEEVTELRFRIRDVFEEFDFPVSTDGRITFDEAVPIGDGVFLEYGTVTGDAVAALEDLVERVPHFEEVTILNREDDVANYELRLDHPPLVSAIATTGGAIEEAVVEDGDLRLRIHLSPTVEARRIIDVIEEAYPAAEMVARRQTTRPTDGAERTSRTLTSTLTDRQRAALDAAYHSGYFEWPRESTGEDVAASLGISSPTFYQHLRAAENKLLAALYSGPGPATT